MNLIYLNSEEDIDSLVIKYKENYYRIYKILDGDDSIIMLLDKCANTEDDTDE